ncbi:hypothetical protein [Planctomicrobium sp. SH664]|uniref:hypothetical protein n=1 Tax=Planctomicrobium sp. SH664 TaxID=3448125 RepID=UPI003F5C8161
MQTNMTDRRITWLAAGALLGMAISYYCPTEPAYAETASSNTKFAMCTAQTLLANSEAVFILDGVTGRLFGAAFNTASGTFAQSYGRNLAQDFQTTGNAQYVMVSGFAQMNTVGGVTPASSAIYVGELNSGKVIMYGFPYANGRQGTYDLVPVAQFPWRQASR